MGLFKIQRIEDSIETLHKRMNELTLKGIKNTITEQEKDEYEFLEILLMNQNIALNETIMATQN